MILSLFTTSELQLLSSVECKMDVYCSLCKNVNLKNLPPGDYRNFVIGAQFYYITNDRSCYDSQTQGPCQWMIQEMQIMLNYSEFVLKEWQRRGFLIDRMSSARSGAALESEKKLFLCLKLYKSLLLRCQTWRTACPRLEVFTFCWALLSLSFFCLPFSTSPNCPSLALWRRTTHWKERGTWPQTRPEREKYCGVKFDRVHVQNKRGHMTSGLNLRDEQGNDWSGSHLVESVFEHTWRQKERVGVRPGGQGQHVPNKHREKTINRTFTAGEKYGGSWGGLLRRKIAGKWPFSSQSHWEHPKCC